MSTTTSTALHPPTQTALPDPHTVAANGSNTVPTTPSHHHRPHDEPCSPTKPLRDHAPTGENLGIRSARHTLITAITTRITRQHLTAAQAAAILHLTGPKVTQLLQANIDEFTLDELVNLLPALQLTIQVVPAPEPNVRSSG